MYDTFDHRWDNSIGLKKNFEKMIYYLYFYWSYYKYNQFEIDFYLIFPRKKIFDKLRSNIRISNIVHIIQSILLSYVFNYLNFLIFIGINKYILIVKNYICLDDQVYFKYTYIHQSFQTEINLRILLYNILMITYDYLFYLIFYTLS